MTTNKIVKIISQLKISTLLVVLLFIIIGIYGYFRASDLLHGSELKVSGLTDGETYTGSFVDLTGSVHNIQSLSVNNMPILSDQSGSFSDSLILLPGYNVISVRAENQFGKVDEKVFHVRFQAS